MISLVFSLSAEAVCPCYTLSSSANTGNCGVEAVAGTNPTLSEWQTIFATVSQGPGVWGSNGPSVSNLGSGCGKPQAPTTVPARFPCEILKAIAMQESGWRQFCLPDRPADQASAPVRTIISFDCGYGVGQVTSGMHRGEAPNFDRSRVASDALYNLATGTQILAEKWRATRCVGDNQPSIVEHWYSAVWAYNGLAFVNSPNNPNYSATRGIYKPAIGGSAPYQERVWGWLEFPPSEQHWVSLAPAYPALTDIGTGSSPATLPEPDCEGPTACTQRRAVHRSACLSVDAGTDAGTVGPDAGASDAGPADGGDMSLSPIEETHQAAPCGCQNAGAGLLCIAPFLAARFSRRKRL